MNRTALAFALTAALLAQGCAKTIPSPLPLGAAAYDVIPEHDTAREAEFARIGAGDRVSIKVFGEKELSSDDYIVDGDGSLQFPLLGEVIAAGKSARELSAEVTARLGARFVRSPFVTVQIMERPRSTFAVEGAVEGPGVFEATPNTTLLSALAQARSPNKVAQTTDVVVLRSIDGKPAGARFDVEMIRRGSVADPHILPGDKIVVPTSKNKALYRDLLQTLPLLNLFVLLR